MKTSNFLKSILLTLTLVSLSCSGGDSSDSNSNNGNSSNTTIILTGSKSNVQIGETITFTVKNQSNLDVTNEATLKVNDQNITGNTWTATTSGQFSITAQIGNLTSNAYIVNVAELLTALTLSTPQNAFYQGEEITFNVIGNNGSILTDQCTITLNNNDIGGNDYTPTSSGMHEFVATYQGISSNTLQLDVMPPPSKFNQRVLIEDYTGTWCGYCPRVSYAIEQVKGVIDDASIIAIHNSDPMANSIGTALENQFNITGFPTAKINRTSDWIYPEPSNVTQIVNAADGEANVGLAINPSLNGNTMTIDIGVKFGGLFNQSGTKLAVYIVEDGLIYDQTNYTSYYGGTATIANFEHNEVMRDAITSPFGDTIPSAEVAAENVYTIQFTESVPNNVTNTSNISVVAFIANSSNQVINVRTAHFGSTQTFEEL